ncbi:hypothetical protein [Streptomyces sp. GC420]|uniref:hypothetical protein n=1 Tax=Streptomyces sp. GC420 TaxID=2697568 RepID=UPI001414E603|nr:hypothetical protein [Streptomyces sp. GC420]NBM20229.1 hypothetical protein [Streptomyces sp. GC420]
MATGEPQGPQGGGIHIGSVRGAFAIGDRNTVTSNAAPAGSDAAQEELLLAVRELRADLARLVATPQTEALAGELAETEEEIANTGRAGTGRLTRLRASLQDAATATGMLASGVAVGQAVGALLGG